jgi:hypothetical protein
MFFATEVTEKGFLVLVPSPFGRGLGRGQDLNSSPVFLFYSPPHPGLLPKGEGAKQKKVL